MNGTTRCPHCETRFKVSQTQLAAFDGMVRCGCCKQAFDARPSYQPETDAFEATVKLPKAEETSFKLDIPETEEQHTVSLNENLVDTHTAARPNKPALSSHPRFWPISTALLTLTLICQIIFFFRVDIAAHAPGLKPALQGLCAILQCEVPLPQLDEFMSLESSDLESSHKHMNYIVLKANIRNRANFTLAYPHLELTLSDTQEQALARRVFQPAEYLPEGSDSTTGLPGKRDLSIKLELDTKAVKASGYKLALFYPAH